MNKLVIANSHKEKHGKSSSVKEVFNQLSTKYPANVRVIINDGDIKAIIEVKGIKVGIESQGDPNSRMPQSMDDFVAAGCDIIVTACRTKWTTYDKVDIDLRSNRYDIIWTSNDKYYDKFNTHVINILNDRYAKRIIQLIEDRIAGII